MRGSPKGDCTTVEYWDTRVLEARNEDDMIFIDGRRDEFWRRVRRQLQVWRSMYVMDVACGFGKFAAEFEPPYYQGVDFSAEMIKLANEKFPHHEFRRVDIHDDKPYGMRDVIFEVNSLKSLGMTAEQFINKFSPYARMAVACLEADEFRISNVYPK